MLQANGRLTDYHLRFDVKDPIFHRPRYHLVNMPEQNIRAVEKHSGENHVQSIMQRQFRLMCRGKREKLWVK